MSTIDRLENYVFNHFTLLAGWNAQYTESIDQESLCLSQRFCLEKRGIKLPAKLWH